MYRDEVLYVTFGEQSVSKWSPPPMDTGNSRDITGVLPASWTGIRYLMEAEVCHRNSHWTDRTQQRTGVCRTIKRCFNAISLPIVKLHQYPRVPDENDSNTTDFAYRDERYFSWDSNFPNNRSIARLVRRRRHIEAPNVVYPDQRTLVSSFEPHRARRRAPPTRTAPATPPSILS
ncbi:hypothetical protein EVAR_7309_1 [Eumeta japonica]|uniref:Uncharacterized protein n=1 Tax=Eumeta variegata TaxID=151549 RepID=A0A4C1T2S3_EUMVA|nr:hypothetical protein EVAR_7309_1 [Eumeta japonica]